MKKEFTGQYDAYSKPIHVGDILEDLDEGYFSGGEVIEDNGEYLLRNWHCGGCTFKSADKRIVGNIADNPELKREYLKE